MTTVLLASCLPERSLSSYTRGSASGTAMDSAPRSGGLDAALDSTIVSDDRPDPALADALDAGSAGDTLEASDGRGDSPSTLACRAECICERREDRDFMFCATVLTHAEAVESCATAGGALVSVDDSEQNTWLSQRMQEAVAVDDFWLSGTDTENEGVWRWQDGRIFFDVTSDAASGAGYVSWDSEQPNDMNGEDCMRSIAGLWLDLDCGSEIAFACQG